MAENTQYKNFSVATVNTGYAANTASIDLQTNHGLKLPTINKPFYAVWWNSTDYSDPADDPNVEIVQCYKRIGDKLLIRRGCLGTTASSKNATGKTYKIAQFLDHSILNKKLLYFKNPSKGTYYFNDFDHAVMSSGSNVSFNSFVNSVTSSGTSRSIVAAEANKVGIIESATGTTVAARTYIFFASQSSISPRCLRLCQNYIETTWWVKFPNIIDGISTDFNFACGFMDGYGPPDASNNSVLFCYKNDSTKWQIVIEKSNIEQIRESTSIVVEANRWYELKIKTFIGNICEFYINKTLVKSYSGVIPENSNELVSAGLGIMNVGGIGGAVHIDAFEFIAKFPRERNTALLNGAV